MRVYDYAKLHEDQVEEFMDSVHLWVVVLGLLVIMISCRVGGDWILEAAPQVMAGRVASGRVRGEAGTYPVQTRPRRVPVHLDRIMKNRPNSSLVRIK